MAVTKKAGKMTDKELLDAWQKGREWMMTVEEGSKLWEEGLARMDELEDEMRERRIGPWEGKE